MPDFYSADTVTVGGAAAGLQWPGLDPSRPAGDRHVLRVADAAAVHDAIRQNWAGADVRRDPLYFNGTFELLNAFGGRPHGFPPEPVTTAVLPPAPHWDPVPAGMRRPVVALLDDGVRDHVWWPKTTADDPFLIDAEAGTWDPMLPAPGESAHATFMAGLIRQAAPSTRVLSVRVADADGAARESTLVRAFEWLLDHSRHGNPVDVVCVPFGRMPGPDDDRITLDELERAIAALVAAGVPVTASAGSDHVETHVYPAAFRGVTAVGAGISGYHARFSNHGGWVDRYREGVEVQSVLPPDGWGRWNGTSFAAAHFAADLARPQVV